MTISEADRRHNPELDNIKHDKRDLGHLYCKQQIDGCKIIKGKIAHRQTQLLSDVTGLELDFDKTWKARLDLELDSIRCDKPLII